MAQANALWVHANLNSNESLIAIKDLLLPASTQWRSFQGVFVLQRAPLTCWSYQEMKSPIELTRLVTESFRTFAFLVRDADNAELWNQLNKVRIFISSRFVIFSRLFLLLPNRIMVYRNKSWRGVIDKSSRFNSDKNLTCDTPPLSFAISYWALPWGTFWKFEYQEVDEQN